MGKTVVPGARNCLGLLLSNKCAVRQVASTVNRMVAGSSPARGARFFSTIVVC
jgi:hypothetical protein